MAKKISVSQNELQSEALQVLSSKAKAAGLRLPDLKRAAVVFGHGIMVAHVPLVESVSLQDLANGTQISVVYISLPENAIPRAFGIPAGLYTVHLRVWLEQPREAQIELIGLEGQGTIVRPVPLPFGPSASGEALPTLEISANAHVSIGATHVSINGNIDASVDSIFHTSLPFHYTISV